MTLIIITLTAIFVLGGIGPAAGDRGPARRNGRGTLTYASTAKTFFITKDTKYTKEFLKVCLRISNLCDFGF
ncbi:MAG: hypothetical protein ACOY0R_02240 [Chloroflexota bacterium]